MNATKGKNEERSGDDYAQRDESAFELLKFYTAATLTLLTPTLRIRRNQLLGTPAVYHAWCHLTPSPGFA